MLADLHRKNIKLKFSLLNIRSIKYGLAGIAYLFKDVIHKFSVVCNLLIVCCLKVNT